MDRRTERELMRLLHGELREEPANRLRARLREDGELRRSYEQLRRSWLGLELAEPPPPPPGFAARVVARARETADRGLAPAWWSRTVWGRAATAAVLAGGVVIGALLAAPGEAENWSEYPIAEPTLAESYWQALEASEGELWEEDAS